jgi:hypothetical protein
MTHVGEVRESVYIDCKHWDLNINLRAKRQGSLWTIWRPDTGQAVTDQATLQTRWVDLSSTQWPNVHIEWNGLNFRVRLSDRSLYINITNVLVYMGHDARECWRCYWDPRQNGGAGGFHHTCVRIVENAFYDSARLSQWNSN